MKLRHLGLLALLVLPAAVSAQEGPECSFCFTATGCGEATSIGQEVCINTQWPGTCTVMGNDCKGSLASTIGIDGATLEPSIDVFSSDDEYLRTCIGEIVARHYEPERRAEIGEASSRLVL